MGTKLSTIVALTAAFAPPLAHAIGFGEISLQSRVGEALMAEVPIISSNDALIAACFSMAALRGKDLPVITAAKPRLIRRGSTYILQIVGTQPINEPIFAVGVKAGCGYDIEREYVLMPEPPIELARTVSATTTRITTPTSKSVRSSQWQARGGETLGDVAEAQAPASSDERQRILDALKRSNPQLDPDMPLAEGTVVYLPPPKRTATPRKATAERQEQYASQARAPQPKLRPPKLPKAPSQPALANGDTKDRLVLGAATETIEPKKPGNSGLTSMAETEERLLKLETTLHQLTQEMEKMDQAIELATKAIEAQNRLQLAQTMQTPTAAGPGMTHTPPAPPSDTGNWWELLLSAAVGAVASIGMAQYLGRRRRPPGDDELPLAFAGYRSEVTPLNAPAIKEDARSTREEMTASVPILAEITPDNIEVTKPAEPDVIEANVDDEHSVLELAEIMLSFGRLRGAADTLAEHIDLTLPKSIEPWSMLLDLYRRGGMRQEFEELAAKMSNRFNAKVPTWNDSNTPISGLKTLEDYPHVIQKASRLWGMQEGVDYLLSLVHDTRAGQRNGFPLEVVEEIALLIRILVDAYELKRNH